MQLTEQLTELSFDGRKRVETIVENLAASHSTGETLEELAHDARNMVAALELYCELLCDQGVLSVPFQHYGNELRLVASTSRRLVEKLVALNKHYVAQDSVWKAEGWKQISEEPIDDFAMEVLANRNLLAALAGPSILLSIDTNGCNRAINMSREDLTRILVNLIKNAAEAMPRGGQIHIGLQELPAAEDQKGVIVFRVEDNGTGIPSDALERIFTSGYTTHCAHDSIGEEWLASHRGLGLVITRNIVEAAGGKICAMNRSPHGARFEVILPIKGTPRKNFGLTNI